MNHSSASPHSRRSFLTLCGAIGAGLATHGTSSSALAETTGPDATTAKTCPIGLELYSVRGELGRDLPNTLKTVAQI